LRIPWASSLLLSSPRHLPSVFHKNTLTFTHSIHFRMSKRRMVAAWPNSLRFEILSTTLNPNYPCQTHSHTQPLNNIVKCIRKNGRDQIPRHILRKHYYNSHNERRKFVEQGNTFVLDWVNTGIQKPFFPRSDFDCWSREKSASVKLLLQQCPIDI